MKNKLIEIIAKAKQACDDTRTFEEAIADELIAEGVLVPPCKVGDTLYAAIIPFLEGDPENGEIDEWTVKGIAYEGDGKWWIESKDDEWYELGENLCKLTREEAEKALKEAK